MMYCRKQMLSMRDVISHPPLLAAVFLAVLSLCVPGSPWAAEAQEAIPQWRHFTIDDGLAANDVWTLLQDQDGSLWFGTNGGGVSHFNGRWATFTQENTGGGLAGNRVRCILQARDGSLWFGTSHGLSHYRDQEWQLFRRENGLADDDVRSLLQTGDGVLWAGTNGGLASYDGQNWRRFTVQEGLAGDGVYALWQDRDGLLWVGSDGGLSYCEVRGQFACITLEELAGASVRALFEDRDGRVWAATGDGLLSYDGRRWTSLGVDDGLPAARVLSMLQDNDGFLWFGTDGGGVSRYDGQTIVATLTSADGLPADNVRSLIKDRDGALWFGTLGGVSRYDARTWHSWLGDQTIMGIAPGPKGNLWVATAEDGLRYYEDGDWHSRTAEEEGGAEGLPTSRMEVLFQASDGALWVGTNGGGLTRLDGQGWRTFTRDKDGLASDLVTTIYEADDGTLWVGTDQGLSAYDGEQWESFTSDADSGLTDNMILAIAQDPQGILWVGTRAGLSRYDGQQWLEPFTRANSGLAADEVRAILPSGNGSLWFGTWTGGVSHYDGETWHTYTVADGLAANAIFSIIEDSDGILWFGTLSGATRYDGRTWLSYTTGDGLTNNVVRVIHEDDKGVVWIGTQSGLSRYESDPGTPSARVISVNGRPYEGGIATMLSGEPLDIQFDGGDLRTPLEDLVFICYLEGTEQSWQLRSRFFLGSLSRGDYVFHLRVRDEDFNYSPSVDVPILVKSGAVFPWIGRPRVVPAAMFASVVLVALAAVGAAGLYVHSRRQTRRRGRGALRRRFNPYISGEPIRREDMFFGRDRLLRDIMDILHNNSIMIHGERRIGKTTVLYQLANRLRQDTDPEYLFVPVLVDLEGTPREALFHTVMDGIVLTFGALLPEVPQLVFHIEGSGEYSDRDFGRDFRRLLEALKQTTDKKVRVVLLMDEMDAIDAYGRMVQLQLRRIFMTDFSQSLGAVVAGVQISRKWDRPESPWYNLFHEMRVRPFTEQEARELITEPVKGAYRYEEQAVQRLIAYGKGRPYRIQQYCLEAVNHMLGDDRRKVRLADVEAAHETIRQAWGDHP